MIESSSVRYGPLSISAPITIKKRHPTLGRPQERKEKGKGQKEKVGRIKIRFLLLPFTFLLFPSLLHPAKCRVPPELLKGVEPLTSSLPRTRSTTELQQRRAVYQSLIDSLSILRAADAQTPTHNAGASKDRREY